MRLFSIPSFRFSAIPTLGRYSRIATFGKKSQEGAEIVFDAKSLGEMVDNFGARGDKLAICQDHLSAHIAQTGRPAPAMGYFTALALIEGGKLVKFASVDAGAVQPDPTGMEDGLYACLGEITSLGADLKEGLGCYAFLSPMFSESAEAEDGTPIGFALFDVAATNTPFQAGTQIQFHRLGATPAKPTGAKRALSNGVQRMNPELMKRFGIDENDDEKTQAEKMAKYFADHDEKMGRLSKFDAAEAASAPEGDDSKDEPDGEEKKAMSAIARNLGLSAEASRREILMAAAAGSVSTSTVGALVEAQVSQAMQAAEQARTQNTKIETLVEQAQAGSFPGDIDALRAFARTNFTAAEKMVAPYAKQGADLFSRVIGAKQNAARPATGSAVKMDRYGSLKVMRTGMDISAAAKAIAKSEKITYSAALDRVRAEHPEMFDAYMETA